VLPAFLITTIAAIAYAHYQGLGFVRASLASPGRSRDFAISA